MADEDSVVFISGSMVHFLRQVVSLKHKDVNHHKQLKTINNSRNSMHMESLRTLALRNPARGVRFLNLENSSILKIDNICVHVRKTGKAEYVPSISNRMFVLINVSPNVTR